MSKLTTSSEAGVPPGENIINPPIVLPPILMSFLPSFVLFSLEFHALEVNTSSTPMSRMS
jgi:hypothetical protein